MHRIFIKYIHRKEDIRPDDHNFIVAAFCTYCCAICHTKRIEQFRSQAIRRHSRQIKDFSEVACVII